MTRRSTILGALFFLVVGASALATYALWGQQVTLPVGVISRGNLDIELVGTASWTETSPDVAPAHAVALQPDGETAAHLATPGDSFTLTQDFTTELEGDNLAARVTVDWDTAPALAPAGQVTASYTLTTPGGTTTAAAPLGSALTLPGTPDNLTPAELAAWPPGSPWRLTVTLSFAGADVLVSPADVATAPVTELGTIALHLDQVRDGDGFDS